MSGSYRNLRRSNDGSHFSIASDEPLASLRRRENELVELFENEGLYVELSIELENHPKAQNMKQRGTGILYGDQSITAGLAETLRHLELYLQDPVGATRDVAYLNPQKLFNTPGARTTTLWASRNEEVSKSRVVPVDICSKFTSPDNTSETEGSECLLTKLQRSV